MSLPHGIKLLRMRNSAIMPSYALEGDAGMDLYSAERGFTLPPGETTQVAIGWAMAIPTGYAGMIHSRSGLALRGITVTNSPGVIDSGFRGEIEVILTNHNTFPQAIFRDMRIAQMVIQRVEYGYFEEVGVLPPSDRGTGGFGSTGV